MVEDFAPEAFALLPVMTTSSSGAEFLKQPHVFLNIIGLLGQGLGVPFAAWRIKKITAIDVYGAG